MTHVLPMFIIAGHISAVFDIIITVPIIIEFLFPFYINSPISPKNRKRLDTCNVGKKIYSF